MMAQSSFQLDAGTARAIEELKKVFNVTSNTAVIRKAVALARIAARHSNADDQTIVLLDKDNVPTKVMLAG